MVKGNTHSVKTNEEMRNGKKHIQWLTQENNYLLEKTNHQINDEDPLTAYVKSQESTTLLRYLSTVDTYVEGSFEIHDPWHVDAEGSQPDNFVNHSFGDQGLVYDIFKDKGDFTNLIPPYYSVKNTVPQVTHSFHGEEIPWYFVGWGGNSVNIQNSSDIQTPVIFTSNSSSIEAVYKGHLASNQSRATGHNNGRRICREDGALHLVYEDDGKIWYTTSSDDGYNWTKEELVAQSDYQGTFDAYATNPSLAKFDDILYLVWTEVVSDQDFYIWLNELNLNETDPSWSEAEFVWLRNVQLNLKVPSPAIDILKRENGEAIPIIVYDYANNNDYYLEGFQKEDGVWYQIPDLSINGKNPSLCADPYHNIDNEQMGLAYDYDGAVYFKLCWLYNNSPAWDNSEMVSEYKDWIENQSSPNISMKNGHAHIVWQGLNTSRNHTEVYYRDYEPGSSNTIMSSGGSGATPYSPYNSVTTFSSNTMDVMHPTVASINNQDVAVYYEKNHEFDNLHHIHKKTYSESDGQWSAAYYASSSQYPALVPHQLNGAVWSTYADAPHLINTDANGPSNAIPIEPIEPPGGCNAIESSWEFTYILQPENNNGQIGFINVELDQTTFDGDTLYFDDFLQTDNFIADVDLIPLDMILKVDYYHVNVPPADQEILFNMKFEDDNGNIHLTEIEYHELPDSGVYYKSVNVANLHVREGIIKITFPEREPLVNYIMNNPDGEGGQQKSADIVTHYKPDQFKLSQNYPNPFNPITHIKFELPEASHVTLQIVDVNGKVVSTEIDDYRPAGVHETIFDGKNLSSGIYFYRIRAGNFVQTKRMLLVK
ncbi:MAG: T9SS type A sorting domain-containing protein [Caldithrix sp.]|nr:T9SS type A sorting domain-containing protein [Caldithrix sp.]